jgi:hypothetical protein
MPPRGYPVAADAQEFRLDLACDPLADHHRAVLVEHAVIARSDSDEAIHLSPSGDMDCFAALAITVAHDHPRRLGVAPATEGEISEISFLDFLPSLVRMEG